MTTTQTQRRCATCSEPVAYDYYGVNGWHHASNPGARGDYAQFGHTADPVPQCPQCRGSNIGHTDAAWGINTDCPDCGYHNYLSIGD